MNIQQVILRNTYVYTNIYMCKYGITIVEKQATDLKEISGLCGRAWREEWEERNIVI